MKSEILFSERQRFNQLWIWLILLSLNAFFIFGFIKQIVLRSPFGSRPMSDNGLIIFTGLFILFSFFIYCIRLETLVKTDGIYIRFFPFHFKYKFYDWNNITKIYIRKYSPISEFGGWGFRISLKDKGRAYNISGNMGLQLEFIDKNKLLIGTNKPEELTETLTKLGRL